MATIRVYPDLSPRLVLVRAPDTTISVQELSDLIKEWEDEPASLTYPRLVSTAGKEDLGGGVSVGITATLLNAQIGFEARTTSDETGTVTTANAAGTTLIDSTATFITNGIQPGDSIFNVTDGSVATVITVDSETQLTHFPLNDGTDNDWDFSDSYKVWNKVQCEINGGNVVAVDDNGSTISSFFPTAFTHVVRTSSSSATLQEQEDIQYTSFDGAIWINSTAGSSGTLFPKGTQRDPVDNLADALTIATTRGIDVLQIVGNFTFGASDVIDGYTVLGEGSTKSTITFTAGCSTDGSEIANCIATGTMTTPAEIRDSHILTVTMTGANANEIAFHDCLFENGTTTMSASQTGIIQILNCYSGVAGASTPVFDLNSANADFLVRNFFGGVELRGIDQNQNVSIDMSSGHVVLASSNTGTSITVRGICKLTDNSTATVVTDGLIQPVKVATKTHVTAMNQA